MNTPSLGFLNMINDGLTADPFTTGAQASGIAPPAPSAPDPPQKTPNFLQTIAEGMGVGIDPGKIGSHFDPRNLGQPGPTPPAPTMMDGKDSASTNAGPVFMPGVSPPLPNLPPAGPPAPPAASAPAGAQPVGFAPDTQMPDDVQYQQVSGGTNVPAHEAYARGPQQDAHLQASFDAEPQAADRGDFRNQLQANAEAAHFENQAVLAQKQQEAAQAVAARRAFQLEQLQLDYSDQVQKLGQMKLDGNRWWSKKSTPDKIGTSLLLALGSLEAIGNGGHNLAYDGVLKEIDDDAAAQRFDWDAGLAQAQGSQNAFKMMMDRYQNEDAAEAAIRAAGLQMAESKLGALHAQYGGVESANAADMLRARFEDARQKTIADGFRMIPAHQSAPKFSLTVRGQKLPGTFSEKDAQGVALKHGVEPAERTDDELTKGGIAAAIQDRKLAADSAIEDKKLAVEKGKKHAENAVVLPNGETVNAPSAQEATTLREMSTNASDVHRLVSEAKQIREKSYTGVPMTPEARARLRQIQADLITSFSVQNKLGALSSSDMELAVAGTADLLNVGLGGSVEAKLDRLNRQTAAKLNSRVATYPGAPAKSSGKMPGSFIQHGDK